MARLRAPSLSKGIILNLFLLLLIVITGGGLYVFFSSIGIVPDASPLLARVPYIDHVPYIGKKLSAPTSTAAAGTLEALEARQAAEARRSKEREFEEKLKTLRRAEEELNAERQRLKQWEEQNRCPANDKLCTEAVWFTQNMLIGPRADMDQIAEAVRKVRANAADLVRS